MSRTLPVKDKSDNAPAIKVSAFRPSVRVTEPHKHDNYFECIFLSSGNGFHTIDAQRFAVEPPIMFFVRREQVHFWELTDEPAGYVMILKKNFIDQLLDGQLRSVLARISAFNCISLRDAEPVATLFRLLFEETSAGATLVTPLLEGLVKVLLEKGLQVAKPQPEIPRRKGRLYGQFVDLLSGGRQVRYKVLYYARLLNTTPQNLNNACRKEVSRSAAEVLSDYIISEARRLLLYTDKTVGEIAYALDFRDPSHFVKYFKRLTGGTPQAYRRQV
jgi:AraC family transcriptional regulator, transcriptional activator of pobA